MTELISIFILLIAGMLASWQSGRETGRSEEQARQAKEKLETEG